MPEVVVVVKVNDVDLGWKHGRDGGSDDGGRPVKLVMWRWRS